MASGHGKRGAGMAGKNPESSRRAALRLLGGVAIVGLGSGSEASVNAALPVPGLSPDDGALDEALKRLQDRKSVV